MYNNSCFQDPPLGPFLKDIVVVQIIKYFFLLLFRNLCVDIQRCLNVLMSHDRLDHLYIGLILTEPGTKCVACNVAAKPRYHNRIPVLTLGFNLFLSIVIIDNALDLTIDARRVMEIAKAVTKDESAHPIQFHKRMVSILLLILLLKFQGFLYLFQHRNGTDSSLCLGQRYLKFASVTLITPGIIGHVVVNADRSVCKIQIRPPKADNLSHSAASSKHCYEKGLPPVKLRLVQIIQKSSLLLYRERMSGFRSSLQLLLDLTDNLIGGVTSQYVISHSKLKCRVKHTVY